MGLLRDPLVLFVVLGGVLASLHLALRSDPQAPERRTDIVVTDADVDHIRRVYEKTWQRPPTGEQLQVLIDRRVREEILYREALALGLDQGDRALRRRLALKLEFLARDAAQAAPPTESDLRAYLAASPGRYARRGLRSFVHVFVSEARRGDKAGPYAKALLERLRGDERLDLAALGDRTLLEAEQAGVSPRDVTAIFGDAFSKALFEQPVGVWSGPLRSGYGLHLVLVREDVPGSAPPFEEVRDRLLRDLLEQRGEDALRAYVALLHEKYDVSIRASFESDGAK